MQNQDRAILDVQVIEESVAAGPLQGVPTSSPQYNPPTNRCAGAWLPNGESAAATST
jgi:hypothetical protein